MDKDFDTTLSDAINLAAGAAHTQGASAARILGRKRTMRKRIVMSTAAFVVLAGGAATAFKAADGRGGDGSSPAVNPVTSTGHVVQTTPPPTGPATTAPTGTAPTGTAATSTAPTTTQGPSKHLPQWLTAAQVPFADVMHWTLDGSPVRCTGSEVFVDIYSATDCGIHNAPADAHPAQTMDVQQYRAVGVPSGPASDGNWQAQDAAQEFFTYADAADAKAAYQQATAHLVAQNGQTRGAVDTAHDNQPIIDTVTVTAQTGNSTAIVRKFRHADGTPAQLNGNYSEQSDLHFYFALKGKVLEVVEIRGGTSIGGTSQDAAFLATVTAALD